MRRPSSTMRFSPPSWTLASSTPATVRAASAAAAQIAVRAELDAISLADERDQLPARALGADLALVDDPDAVAEALGLLHVVRRVQDRHALPAQLLDAREDGVAALRVDADRRLVEQQQRAAGAAARCRC